MRRIAVSRSGTIFRVPTTQIASAPAWLSRPIWLPLPGAARNCPGSVRSVLTLIDGKAVCDESD